MLIRLRTAAADAVAARLVAERLGDWEMAEPALATTLFEDQAKRIWLVDAYYDDAPDLGLVLVAIGELVLPDHPTTLEPVPDENWVAISQAALPPVDAGRFLVHGSHDRAKIGRRHFALEIDAGEAFGTAHHATTQSCLEALDQLARRRPFWRILDLGCGSGVLALAASRVWPRAQVSASDIDPIAVEVGAANVALNRARPRVTLVTAPGLDHPKLRERGPFDLVLANILAGPLIRLAPTLARHMRPHGHAVLSGILTEQAREVVAVYALAGFRLETRTLRHGWATLVLQRRPDP